MRVHHSRFDYLAGPATQAFGTEYCISSPMSRIKDDLTLLRLTMFVLPHVSRLTSSSQKEVRSMSHLGINSQMYLVGLTFDNYFSFLLISRYQISTS